MRLIVVALACAITTAARADVTYYIDGLTGSDSNTCTQAAPCLTLAHANRICAGNPPHDNVVVSIAADVQYVGQNPHWTCVDPAYTVTISSPGDPSDRASAAIFDNCSPTECFKNHFFDFITSAGQNGGAWSNIALSHIVVQDYANPIWFLGDVNDPANGWNGNNSLSYVWIENSGSCYHQQLPESYGLVNVYNSPDFTADQVTVENACTTPAADNVYLHAFYVESYSDDCAIANSTFRNVSGDVIRIRDQSDDCMIEDNSFFAAGSSDALVTQWWCRGSPQECQKTLPECPSTGLVVVDNYYDGGVDRQRLPLAENLYPASGCGITLAAQAITRAGNRLDYAAWPD